MCEPKLLRSYFSWLQECNSTACLEHLPTAWPSLQVLQLRGGVLPTAITPEQLALLAVAPHLQRLELFVDASNRMLWQFDRQFRQANNNRVEVCAAWAMACLPA